MEKYFGISKRITKWKEMNPFEEYLAEEAGKSNEAKKIYANYYRFINPEYYDKGREFAYALIDSHADDFKGLQKEEIYYDMVYCLHRYGYSFLDYCVYNFRNKTDAERLNYVADKLRYYYCDILNDREIEHIMTDKYKCYSIYRPFYKREIVKCIDNRDKEEFLAFISRRRRFIYKPLCEHSGHGITIFDTSQLEPELWFKNIIETSPGIVEELILQGAEMNELNSSAVNTCRIMTFTLGNEVHIIGAALRMGVGNAITDNAGAGGIYAAIDYESGRLISYGSNFDGEKFELHPDTHIKIKGFQLPEWEEAKSLIQSMALFYKGTTLVSWDIAFSSKGWCMVEGNDNGGWRIMQTHNNGLKSKLISFMDNYLEK